MMMYDLIHQMMMKCVIHSEHNSMILRDEATKLYEELMSDDVNLSISTNISRIQSVIRFISMNSPELRESLCLPKYTDPCYIMIYGETKYVLSAGNMDEKASFIEYVMLDIYKRHENLIPSYNKGDYEDIMAKLSRLEEDPLDDDRVFALYDAIQPYVIDDSFRSTIRRILEDGDSVSEFIHDVLKKNKEMSDPEFVGFLL